MEYSTSGANHREVGEGLRMLYLAPPLSNLNSFIKPFKDGQIMSLAKAFTAFDISLSRGNDRAAVGAVVKEVVKTSMGGGLGQCCLEKLSSSL